MKKKMVSVLLALAMCLGLAAAACATEIAPEESEVPVQTEEATVPEEEMISHEGIIEDVGIIREDNARDANVPTKHWNLSGSGDYTASFADLAATKAVNTLYYFTTSTGNISFEGKLMRSGTTTNVNRTLQVELYERTKDGATWTLVRTEKVYFNTAEYSVSRVFAKLNPNYFYYIHFVNVSSSSTGDSLDISGKLTISE